MSRTALAKLWQSPRSAREITGRRVTFLELFYDLVYVVIIAQLTHALAAHPDLNGVGSFVFLFILVWWLWFNAAYYHNLHGYDDLRTRVFAFLQMAIAALLAVFAHHALGEDSQGFALSYGAFVAVICFLWWRTGVHDPDHAPLSRPYVASFSLAVVMFLASPLVPTPWRFWLWGLALLLMLVWPGIVTTRGEHQDYLATIDLTSPSLQERFKLFTIIVLGEVIIGVVSGLSELDDLSLGGRLLGALGLGFAFGLWWAYFDISSEHPVKQSFAWKWVWNLIHLPIWIGISAVGPAVLNIVAAEGEDISTEVIWLLAGALALSFSSMAVFMQTFQLEEELHRKVYRTATRMFLAMAAASLVLGTVGERLDALVLMLGFLLLMLIPILYEQYVQLEALERAEEKAREEKKPNS